MDNLNPSEISQIIKERINNLESSTQESNEGTIVFLSDGIARIHGLSEVMYGELIEFEGGITGMHWWLQYLHAGTWTNAGIMYYQCTDCRKE